MLTRGARAVLDLGRHVERADGVGRLLALHVPLLDAAEPARREALTADLLSLAGASTGSDAGRGGAVGLLDRLGYDEACPASVLGAWAAARSSARAAQDVLPAQVVEVLEASRAAVPATRWRGRDAGAFLAWVRERTAAVTGSADSSCPRDEAWWFLRLGTSLERASWTALMVASTSLHASAPGQGDDEGPAPLWRAVLGAAGAPAAMTARVRTPAEAAGALLLDRAWPRSVVAALAAAEEALDGLESAGLRRDVLDAPRQRLVRTRTRLEYQPVEDSLGDLDTLARQVRRSASAVGRGVEEACLEPAGPSSWLVHAG